MAALGKTERFNENRPLFSPQDKRCEWTEADLKPRKRHCFSLSAWILPLNQIKLQEWKWEIKPLSAHFLPGRSTTPPPPQDTRTHTHTELIGNKYVKLYWLLTTNPWHYLWDESRSIAQECTITPASAAILSRMSNKNTNRNREGRAQIWCSACTSAQTINCSASNYRNPRVEVGQRESRHPPRFSEVPHIWRLRKQRPTCFSSNRLHVKPLKGFISVRRQSTGPPPQRPSIGCSSTCLRDNTAKERKHSDKQGDRDQYRQ